MIAFIVLTPEERQIVVNGRIEDPTYRPFPGSKQAQELDEHVMRELRQSFDHFLDQDRAAEEGGGTEFVHHERSFMRTGAATHWPAYEVVPVLLITPDPSGLQLVGLGRVRTKRFDRGRTGARLLDVRADHVLDEAVALREIVDAMPARERATFRRLINGEARTFPAGLGAAIMTALLERHPGLQVHLREIIHGIQQELAQRASRRVNRTPVLKQEAASTALHIFSPAWQSLQPMSEPEPSAFAEGLAIETSRYFENDVVTDDASVFPGWNRNTQSVRGWWGFTNRDRRLWVKNINASPLESETGADLVYVHRDPDAVVLVQYKLLESLADGRLIFRPEGRLDGQVRRMRDIESRPPGALDTDALDTYRIGKGFTFVKFVHPKYTGEQRPGRLSPGYYYPTDFMRRLLAKPDSGPNNGVVYFIHSHRSLTPRTFEELVRDVWVGSTGDVTASLTDLLGLRETEAPLILAVDEPAPRDAED